MKGRHKASEMVACPGDTLAPLGSGSLSPMDSPADSPTTPRPTSQLQATGQAPRHGHWPSPLHTMCPEDGQGSAVLPFLLPDQCLRKTQPSYRAMGISVSRTPASICQQVSP